jgi:Dyp-type peroxidase family
MDLSDIQGLVFHAYRRLPYAAYVLLRFQPHREEAARRWLSELVLSHSIDSATPKDVGPDGRPAVRLNIAFTYTGLVALGLDPDAQRTFPLAFVDGLGAKWKEKDGGPNHRSRALGDLDASAPHGWEWGYQGDGGVDEHGRRHPDSRYDALLLVFATDKDVLHHEVGRWIDLAVAEGALIPGEAMILLGRFPEGDEPVREPFGFVDGISQPVLKGARGKLGEKGKLTQPTIHEVEDGEILLGHRDGARQVSMSPTVDSALDPNGLLPVAYDDPARRDLGYNGTYLVFRQLLQDVTGFNAACRAASDRVDIPEDRFRALLVGRWHDGSPVITCPIAHDPARATAPAANDFRYRNDPHGERCPVGAHIRRANPRDSLGDNPDQSWRVSNRHRILRRGRRYDNGGEQGLHFICLNASIERQFEFIQQNWINDATFGGLDHEDDPIVGPRQGSGGEAWSTTLPPPADSRVHRRMRVPGLSPFVTVKGGGYFFLPSLTALRYLAHLPAPRSQPSVWSPEEAPLTKSEWVRFLFLARFPVLLGVVLVAAPLMIVGENSQLATIARPMFLLGDPRAMVMVSALASLAAAVAMFTWRIVQLYARLRFDAATPSPPALTWPRFLRWQAVSFPIVGTTLCLSAHDAVAGPAGFPLRELGGELVKFGLAALGGYAIAFGVLLVAAMARNRSVNFDNDQETLFFPASSMLARLKGRPSWLPTWIVESITGPIVRFVEGTAATWPPDRAAGYIDHDRGKIRPGHIAAAMLAVLLGLVYLTGWLLLWPAAPLLGFEPPPLAYLLFLLMIAGWVAAGASFFLDRFRVPLLAVLAAWLVLVGIVGGSDHEFIVSGAKLSEAPSVASMIASADTYHARRNGANASAGPIVVVAAGGGGVHQAAWTARVLTGLTELWGSSFSGNVRLISGVSAGSVGAMHFVMQFKESGPPDGNLQSVVEAAMAPSTSNIWWGIAYPDLTRTLLPFPVKGLLPGTLDRGWAMEQAWRRAMGLGSDDKPTMGQWQTDVAKGWRPAVALNAMVVESGTRVVLATYGLPEGNAAGGVASITDRQDLSVTTAARLSASFPYITPFARPRNSGTDENRMIHLTDGGYWDNHAVVTILEWLRAAEPVLNGRRHVLVVQIPPPRIENGRGHDRAWAWQMKAPLEALASMRTSAQETRNRSEIQQYKQRRREDLTWVEFPYKGPDTMLSWHLSRRERCAIEKAWQDEYGEDRAVIDQLVPVLGTPRPWVRPVLKDCAP